MYSSVCFAASSLKSSKYGPPPMAVSRGPLMSECRSCRGSVAREVVFGVKGFHVNLDLMQLSQSQLPVIFGALATTFGKISKAVRPTCARQRCHDICFSASCQDSCPVVLSASRQLTLISVYLVDSGASFRTNSPLTRGAVVINLPWRLWRFRP